jgi:hypothetical protein
LKIFFGEIVIIEIEFRNRFRIGTAQRVRVRMLVSTETIGIDQLQDANLLALPSVVRCGDHANDR